MRQPVPGFLRILPLLGLALLLSCSKAYPPPPPIQEGGAEVSGMLHKTEDELKALRDSAQLSDDLWKEASDLLAEAKVLNDKGESGQAYMKILKARALLEGAKASLALGKSGKPAVQVEQGLKEIKRQAQAPIRPLRVKVGKFEADRALKAVRQRLVRLKKETEYMKAQWQRADGVMRLARAAYDRGNYDEALHGAGKVDAEIGWLTENFTLPRLYGEAKIRTWQVRERDTLWDIAGSSKVYGDPVLWTSLFAANKDLSEYPDFIREGWVLSIPEDAFAATAFVPRPAAKAAPSRPAAVPPARAKAEPKTAGPAASEESLEIELEPESSEVSVADEVKEIPEDSGQAAAPASTTGSTRGDDLEGLPQE